MLPFLFISIFLIAAFCICHNLSASNMISNYLESSNRIYCMIFFQILLTDSSLSFLICYIFSTSMSRLKNLLCFISIHLPGSLIAPNSPPSWCWTFLLNSITKIVNKSWITIPRYLHTLNYCRTDAGQLDTSKNCSKLWRDWFVNFDISNIILYLKFKWNITVNFFVNCISLFQNMIKIFCMENLLVCGISNDIYFHLLSIDDIISFADCFAFSCSHKFCAAACVCHLHCCNTEFAWITRRLELYKALVHLLCLLCLVGQPKETMDAFFQYVALLLRDYQGIFLSW